MCATIKLKSPHPGNVKTHARAISETIFQLTDDSLFDAPTPIIAVVFVCVVLVGMPVSEEKSKQLAAPKQEANP